MNWTKRIIFILLYLIYFIIGIATLMGLTGIPCDLFCYLSKLIIFVLSSTVLILGWSFIGSVYARSNNVSKLLLVVGVLLLLFLINFSLNNVYNVYIDPVLQAIMYGYPFFLWWLTKKG